jgi:hypothetical protein
MANWAFTDYVIEGSKESLSKIYEAIKHPDNPDGSEGWEGGVLRALGIKWDERKPDGSGKYLRGFIQDVEGIEFNPEENTTLSFYAEEAWGVTDFDEILEDNFPDIKVYWCTEEEGMEVYETNDAKGKYFQYRYYVDTCIDNNYQSEYFTTEEAVYQWLSNITNGKIKTTDDVEKFNDEKEDTDEYINIHNFRVVS